MSGVNKIILLGNLCGDPEVRYSQGGKAVASFSLATNETWKDKDGEQQEKVEFHRVVFFGRTAEICGEYLTKGKQIYLEGKIQTRKWEDKEGNTRYTTEVVGQNMQMLGGKGNQEDNNYKESSQGSSQEQPPSPDLDDIPF